MQVYVAEKVWKQMNLRGIAVARCSAERLMRRLCLRGVRRGKVIRTTIGDTNAPCPLDRVNRRFNADRPNQLWVSDFTCGLIWQGWQYVAFVIDVDAAGFWAGAREVPCARTSSWMRWSRLCTNVNENLPMP
jgi:putative transposase